MKKAFIFVPHQDDEINVAGGVFKYLRDSGFETTVVFSTNGDYYPELALRRYKEAKKVQTILGYEHMIYLGYPDGIETSTRVRTCHPDSLQKEFCFLRHGVHRECNKENIRTDVREIIVDQLPEILICVDRDIHYDHILLSDVFDEVIAEVTTSNYNPIVLKSYAYLGKWNGPMDYFSPQILETLPTFSNAQWDDDDGHRWKDRISVPMPSSDYTSLFFWSSPIFRALNKYQTQSVTMFSGGCASLAFCSVANGDMVFWRMDKGLQPLPFPVAGHNCTTRNTSLCKIMAFIFYWYCFLRVKYNIFKLGIQKI